MQLHPDPNHQFQLWYDEAVAAKVPMPDALALATSTSDGRPSVRYVLYKGQVRGGFLLVTNFESQKAREMQSNPRAALAFHWAPLERQVRIEGRVEPATSAESDRYWNTRLRESQIGAWASSQSGVIADRAEL